MLAKAYGVFILVCSVWLLSGGAPAEAKDILTISAASSLKDAFEEIAAAFEAQRKGTKVLLNFASSGRLRNQIAGGAPVDVFASAAMLDMNMLAERGYVEANTINRFAANRLVLIVPRPPTSSVRSFEDLHSPAVQRIAVGNPRTVPVGRYAQELLQHDGLSTALRERLVLAENVRQVLDYVARAEVDAGIVYATDAMTRKKRVRVVAQASADSHTPVLYPIAVVAGTKHAVSARAFIRFVATAERGGAILRTHGFLPVRGND